jgi:hypothetical protein
LAKLILLGAAGGAAAIGWIGYHSLTPPTERPPTPPAAARALVVSKASTETPIAAPDRTEKDAEPPPARNAGPPPRRRPRAAKPKLAGPPQPTNPASTLPSNTVAAEISHLDSVRAALSRGESQLALERLDTYMRKHPRALLGQEAVLLRIEALVQAGRRSSASALARRFLASQPQSPHRKRIESIVGPVAQAIPQPPPTARRPRAKSRPSNKGRHRSDR